MADEPDDLSHYMQATAQLREENIRLRAIVDEVKGWLRRTTDALRDSGEHETADLTAAAYRGIERVLATPVDVEGHDYSDENEYPDDILLDNIELQYERREHVGMALEMALEMISRLGRRVEAARVTPDISDTELVQRMKAWAEFEDSDD